MRRALAALMVAGLALIGAVLWAESPAVPGRAASGPPAADAIELKLVSHGYHAGLALRRIDLLGAMDPARHPALEEVLVRYAFADELEIGWGDEGFYRGVPTIADLTVVEALRAFFAPNNPSVLHIVGLPGPAEVVFDASEVISIRLSPQGFSALVDALEASFARDAAGRPIELGVGLYGPSLFWRAVGTFSIARVCNHWVAELLAEAGVRSNRLIGILPAGLFFDLKTRSGALPLPAPARL